MEKARGVATKKIPGSRSCCKPSRIDEYIRAPGLQPVRCVLSFQNPFRPRTQIGINRRCDMKA